MKDHGQQFRDRKELGPWARAALCGLALVASGCASWTPFAQRPPAKTPYSATFTSEPIAIDGKLDEAAWQRADMISVFMAPATYEPAVSRTEARILWDANGLYVAFKAYDKDVWGYFEAHDDMACREDVLEVFLQPDPVRETYYNFEMNVKGVCLDGYHVKPRSGMGRRWTLWDCPGLTIATSVEGTLNNWQDEDSYWQLEVAIPFASLPSLDGKAPSAGDVWAFHLSRYDYSVYLEESPELTSCAPLSEVSFHLYEDWVPLVFRE